MPEIPFILLRGQYVFQIKGVEEGDDLCDFIVGQRLMAGDGEFLGVDLLCDGQRKGVPLNIEH